LRGRAKRRDQKERQSASHLRSLARMRLWFYSRRAQRTILPVLAAIKEQIGSGLENENQSE
jgi:hypothetical protein